MGGLGLVATSHPHWLTRRLVGRLGLMAPLVAAVWLNWVDIGRVGLGNTYYATAVRSMLAAPHAFLFASFDSGGFVSVDKPPLGLWFQVVSAALFGFSGPALILPSALAGVVSVGLLGMAVRRSSGQAAGILAGAALAVTPVGVVIARDNLLDGPLVALCLAAALATLVATRTERAWPLLLAGICVGLAFNVKFLEAYLIVPALAVTYFLGAPGSRRRRTAVLAGSGAVLLAVSVAWLAFVDLTPPDQRPYVGSTRTNSAFELALGYDGLARLTGQGAPSSATVDPTSFAGRSANVSGVPVTPTLAAPASSDTGSPGIFRLLGPELGGQVGWFIPWALIGFAMGLLRLPWKVWRRGGRPPLSRPQVATLLWGGWFLSGAAFFSVASGFFSPYYLVVIAPPIAALAGDGVVASWRAYWRSERLAWLLPLGVLATDAEAWTILRAQSGWLPWLAPLVVIAGAITSLGLCLALLRHVPGRSRQERSVDEVLGVRGFLHRSIRLGAAVLIAGVLSAAPVLWTLESLRASNEGGHPLAGPSRVGDQPVAIRGVESELVHYLIVHAGSSRFLVATLDTDTATPLIFATGHAVMALGGYSGHDPILTPAALAADITARVVRYAYLPTGDLTAGQLRSLYPNLLDPVVGRNDGRLARWVDVNCTPLPPSAWSTATTRSPQAPDHQLFDCGAERPTVNVAANLTPA
jgi:4-amino-4-deoxy-L-arabinose transferase-like glycosyltransferase